MLRDRRDQRSPFPHKVRRGNYHKSSVIISGGVINSITPQLLQEWHNIPPAINRGSDKSLNRAVLARSNFLSPDVHVLHKRVDGLPDRPDGDHVAIEPHQGSPIATDK